MGNYYGDATVAYEIVNGTTPFTLLDLGDSIANTGYFGSVLPQMLPTALPYGGYFEPNMSGFTGTTFGTVATGQAVGATTYMGNGTYAFMNATEFNFNGTPFSTNQHLFWNRIIESGYQGPFSGGTSDSASINRTTYSRGQCDYLAGNASNISLLLYGGPTVPGASIEALVRSSSNNVVGGYADIGLLSPGQYKLVSFAGTTNVTASDSVTFTIRGKDNTNPSSGQSFAALGGMIQTTTNPAYTIIPARINGTRISHWIDTSRHSANMWKSTLPLLGVTHAMISLCQNENGASTSDQLTTSYLTLIDRLRAANPMMGIILSSSYASGANSQSNITSMFTAVETAMINCANLRSRVCVLKLFSELPLFSANSSYIDTDLIHPKSAAGTQYFLTRKCRLLSQLAGDANATMLLVKAKTDQLRTNTFNVSILTADGSGTPITGVTVVLTGASGYSQSFVTDASGLATAVLECERYSVSATKTGYVLQTKSFSIAGAGSETIVLSVA